MLEHNLELISLCSLLNEKVSDYFRDPKHQKEFEEWYIRKYGKPYPSKFEN